MQLQKFFISQPTVSQTIRELEEHYGILLFERLGKRLYITEGGAKSFWNTRARQWKRLTIWNTICHPAKQGPPSDRRVGYGRNLPYAGYCQEFSCKLPTVETYTYVGNTQTVEERLLRSELDIAIVEGTIKSPELIAIPLEADYLVLFCRNDHRFGKKEIRLRDFAGSGICDA